MHPIVTVTSIELKLGHTMYKLRFLVLILTNSYHQLYYIPTSHNRYDLDRDCRSIVNMSCYLRGYYQLRITRVWWISDSKHFPCHFHLCNSKWWHFHDNSISHSNIRAWFDLMYSYISIFFYSELYFYRIIDNRHNHKVTWWRNQMETFSALLALCEENPAVTVWYPS